MRIPDEIITQIQQTADIVEVVGDYVSLKRQGQNLWACCPFHNERTPSFSVAPAKGIYKCFGCGKAGDSIKFVMDIEGVSYPEALKFLAKRYNIEISEEEPTHEEILRQNEIDSLYIVLNFASEYYQHKLSQTDEGRSIGLSYFKERGFSEETLKAFDLGYSLSIWDGFTKEALAKQFQLPVLEKAGLTIVKENRQYDRFRERVIFPIHNLSGRVIAFGARIMKADKNQPKYINSPETEVYHKSRVLYGMYQAKNAIRQEDNCYLVEGYTDVISLHQAGVANVVASSGTSLTVDQIRLIARFTRHVTVLYDGDAAGIKAALRGTDMALEEGLHVKVVVFPDKEDPDSFVRKVGAAAFKEFIAKHSKDFITFKTELYLKEASNDPFKRAEVIKEVVESITRIPDPITRSVFFKQTSSLLEVDEGTLIVESNKLLQTGFKEQKKKTAAKNQPEAKKPEVKKKNIPENRPPYPEPNYPDLPYLEPPFPDFESPLLDDFREAPPVLDIPPDPVDAEPIRKTSIAYQEEESIRLLISYADHVIEGTENTLCDYILQEIEELEFTIPVYNRILQVFRDELRKGNVISGDYFLRHEDSEIQQEAINLITTKYQVSETWGNKFHIMIPMEKEMLLDVAYTNILRLKQRIVQEKISMNMKELAVATTPTDQDRILRVHMQLKDIEKQIASILGNVIRGK
jgi:DNA primase